MNFIRQVYKGKNEWWRYVLMLLFVFVGWQLIGIIPLSVIAIIHSSDLAAFQRAAADSFMGLGIDANLYLFGMIAMFAIGLSFLFFGIKNIHKRSVTSLLTSRKNLDWNRILFAFAIWFLFSMLLLVSEYFISPETFTWNFKPIPFTILLLISFLFLPLQTSFEEVLFRGYLMQSLGYSVTIDKTVIKWSVFLILVFVLLVINCFYIVPIYVNITVPFLGIIIVQIIIMAGLSKFIYKTILFKNIKNIFSRNWLPLLFTSIAFGLLHSFNPEVEKLGQIVLIYYIGTGFLFGIVTLMDEGLEISLGLHAANNIVAALFVTTNWTVFQTDALFIDTSEPSVGLETFVPVFVIYPLLIFIFSKKYHWKNWKEKLFGKI